MIPGAGRSSPRPQRILLVDDSATVLELEAMILDPSLFDVARARDGEQALQAALAARPDLILMDVVMPRLNGIEALRELRARAETREIPVIMVTTRSEEPIIEMCFRAGCNDYVTKPIDGAELMTKIRNLLGP